MNQREGAGSGLGGVEGLQYATDETPPPLRVTVDLFTSTPVLQSKPTPKMRQPSITQDTPIQSDLDWLGRHFGFVLCFACPKGS